MDNIEYHLKDLRKRICDLIKYHHIKFDDGKLNTDGFDDYLTNEDNYFGEEPIPKEKMFLGNEPFSEEDQ